jgi:hypothetical protein
MMTVNVEPPFTNVQFELIKLFATEIPEEDLIELKKIIAKFLFEKARVKADQVWEKKGYDHQTIDLILNEE